MIPSGPARSTPPGFLVRLKQVGLKQVGLKQVGLKQVARGRAQARRTVESLPTWALPSLQALRALVLTGLFSGLLTGLFSGLLLTGCGAGAAGRQPDTALQSYAEAVRSGDAEAAYAWLSADAKKRMSFKVFERTLKERPEDLTALTDALLRPGQRTAISAKISAANGEQLDLVYEDGAWKADLSAVNLYSQATPVATVASFVRAFEARRYDVLVRFAPTGHKDGLSPEILREAWEGDQRQEMLQLVQALRAQLPTAQAEIVGDRATVAYGQAGSVQLLLEGGAWKIEEF